MSNHRTYHKPKLAKLSTETGMDGIEFNLYGLPVEFDFYYFPEILLDIIVCDEVFYENTIIEIMGECRGAQFACGTIVLKGDDADIPFILTKSEITDHGVFYFDRISIDEKKFTVVGLNPTNSTAENAKTLIFLINLIVAEEDDKKHMEHVSNPKSFDDPSEHD